MRIGKVKEGVKGSSGKKQGPRDKVMKGRVQGRFTRTL